MTHLLVAVRLYCGDGDNNGRCRVTPERSASGRPPGIRLVNTADLESFKALRLEALQRHPEAFGADYAEQVMRPDEFWIERIQQGMGGPVGAIYVAESGSELAGMAGIRRGDSTKLRHSAMIWGVYLRPEMRGQRVADALLAACLAWAESQAVRIVRLSVVSSNGSALRLYLRHGFTIYGVDPEVLYVDGMYHDELLLARRLNGS